MIQPIPTHYAGCYFRSRLEARWAVFFDALDTPWQYEVQGYTLSTGRNYLPDFYLPECRIWVEVKGADHMLDRSLLCAAARELSGSGLMILGPIPEPGREDQDWGWSLLEPALDSACAPEQDWIIPGTTVRHIRCGFGSYAKNRRPWFLDNAQYEPGASPHPRTTPVLDRYESGVSAAYRAARSARFENGESGSPVAGVTRI